MRSEDGKRFQNVIGLTDRDLLDGKEFKANVLDCEKPMAVGDSVEVGGEVFHYHGEDSLGDPCAPFLFPTFSVAEALQLCGRDGSRNFAAAARSRGPLDLFGEVADPTHHTPLGNYPQVQSHAAFIIAATDPRH